MRFHKGSDGWGRGSYTIPQYAVAGSSDCGNWPDSPARSDDVKEELERFRKELRRHKIRSRLHTTYSGNAFMVKRWVVVHSRDFQRAGEVALRWLKEHQHDTRLIHDADLAEAGVTVAA